MAAAAGPFMTSMLSMSSGLRSAIRFCWLSWSSDGFEPVAALVMAFALGAIASSLTSTPSMT